MDNQEYEDLKLLYDFQIKAFTETSNSLSKCATYYLAIMAALVGYILTKEQLNITTKKHLIYIGILISISAVVCAIIFISGLIKSLASIEKTLRYNNPTLYNKVGMDKFLKGGKRAVFYSLLLSCMAVIIFIVALIKYLPG